MSKPWDVGLCGCLQNPSACLLSFFVPGGAYCLQIKAYSILTNRKFCSTCSIMCGLGKFANGLMRARIRDRYNIEGNFYNDMCVWFCCSRCAAVQEMTQVTKFTPTKSNRL